MKLFSVVAGILAAVVVVCVLLMVFGVRFTSDVMAYDPAKEMVTSGTIVGHEEYACPASEGELGDHLVLKAANKTYQIHLAPARVMRSTKWSFKTGDQIQVNGASVRYRGKDGLIARQITRGDEVFTFRDPQGKLLVRQ